jgi:hypothetical protein
VRYKVLALLIFCLTISFIFTGGQLASAFTSDKVQSVPTVNADSTTSLGTVIVKEEYGGSIKVGDCKSFSLPSYVELQTLRIFFPGVDSKSYHPKAPEVTVNYTVYSPGDNVSLSSSGIDLQVEDKNRFTLKVASTEGWEITNTFRCYVYFDSVKIKAGAPEGEEVKATLDGTGGFSPSEQTVAKIASSSGSATASADAPQSITDLGGNIATITISENVAGALKKNDTDCRNKNTVKLVLPAGFDWGAVGLLPGWGFRAGDIDYTVGVDTSGYSVLFLKVNNETTDSTGRGRITIKGNVTVDDSIARAGKVEVSYEGTNSGVSPAMLAVADYSLPGCSLKEKTTTEVIAGHVNSPLGEFTISEGMAGDLARGRTITMTLPYGVKWRTYPTARRESGNCVLGAPKPEGNDGRVIRYSVDSANTGNDKTIFCFKSATVDLVVGAPEQIEITVGGSAGVKGKVVVANVIAPVKLSAGKTSVSVGVQNQDGGELTISEELPGALRAKDATGAGAVLELTLPNGVAFEKLPQVEVTEGNLILDKTRISLAQGDRMLVIPVEKSSSTASTIKVSKISLNVNRMLPEGDVALEAGGTALSETGNLFSGSLNTMKVVLAACVTPAPNDVKVHAVFTIGNDTYEVNGKEQKMDVAPYIKNDRTYGPVRYIAYTLGLGDQDIFWDEAEQTVTLMRGKRVAQLKVGKAAVIIQGIEIPIDVAPEIVEPGRVMIPYRWVAFALGADVSWSEEKQQVTVQSM